MISNSIGFWAPKTCNPLQNNNQPSINRQLLFKNSCDVVSFSGIAKNNCIDQLKALEDARNLINGINDKTSKEYLKARDELFTHEARILIQEITEPEKYLDRAIKMDAVANLPEDREEAAVKLQQESINGLRAVFYVAQKLNINLKNIDYSQLSSSIIDIAGKSCNEKTKIKAFELLATIYEKLPEKQKESVEVFGIKLIKSSQDQDINQRTVNFFRDEVDKSKPSLQKLQDFFINKYEKSNSAEQMTNSLVALAKLKAVIVTDLANDVLNNDKADSNLKIAAVWALGIEQTSKNLKALVGVLKGKVNVNSDKANQLREMALSSISEYDDARAITILEKVKDSNTNLSEYAEALLEKANKSLENKGDHFLNKLIKSSDQQEKYAKARNRFVDGFENLSNYEKNVLDRVLVPFRWIMEDIVSVGDKFKVLNDTITSVETESRGRRNGAGFFQDTAGGLGGNGIVIPKFIFSNKKLTGPVTNHEFGHVIHNYLVTEDFDKDSEIEELYNKAKSEGRFTDYYAAKDYTEYFAQGFAAYNQLFVPHEDMMDVENYLDHFKNTRSQLKNKDPELFNFIEALYKEYSA